MDALTLGLLALGAVLLAAAIVGLAVLAEPTRATPDSPPQPPTVSDSVLQPDSVATVLRVDSTAGVAGAANVGDRVDVLGYFPRQAATDENVTRLLISNAPVLSVTREGANLSLTLAVPQSTALLLHESQALGARPFVLLRSAGGAAQYPPRLTGSELAARLSEVPSGR
jgi:Flp pilus assembly protein CpaB